MERRSIRIRRIQRKKRQRSFFTIILLLVCILGTILFKDELSFPAYKVIANEEKVPTGIDDILILVNKEKSLPKDYKPTDLVVPNVDFPFEEDHPKKYMRAEAAKALEALFEKGKEEGIILYAISGFRSYQVQEWLFNNKIRESGIEAANKLVARPGESEHQTGLAMDVSSQSVQFSLNEDFGESEEGIWLKNHAHEFGFIIRYPKDKTHITRYTYEPWHIRYVGKEAAEAIYKKGITLEEYLGFEYEDQN